MNSIKTNHAMKELLKDFKNEVSVLSKKAQAILDEGFNEIDGCIFFKSEFKENSLPDIDFIKNNYTDRSGYEFSVNKLHLEDYCESNYLGLSLLFVDKFVKKWEGKFGESVVAVLTCDKNDEFGDVYTFQFHKKREAEIVINLDDMENFSLPMLGIETSSISQGK